MERINRLRLHLAASPAPRSSPTTLVSDVFLAPPSGDRAVYDAVLTPEAVAFVAELAAVFQTDVEKVSLLLKCNGGEWVVHSRVF